MLENKVQVVILFFRGGYIIDKANFYLETNLEKIGLNIYQIISQFYSRKTSVPKKIILDKAFPYVEELKKDLSDFSLSKTNFDFVIL